MSMATVTCKFSDNFESWANQKVVAGEWSQEEIEGLKTMLSVDCTAGADQLRIGLRVIVASGVEIPATIDDHEERYRLWSDFFAVVGETIRSLTTEGKRKWTRT